jgi:putative glycerol-1-phosphate prenyltransferase
MSVLKSLHNEIISGQKLLAVLIDPDKMEIEQLPAFLHQVHQSVATHIFLGGSTDDDSKIEALSKAIKLQTHLPVILFPGDVNQITNNADALLFLSLISGDNPEYLIKKQVAAVSILRHSKIEVIPTGYLLIENGKITSVEKVTGTKPMSKHNIQLIVDTAKAGELLGMKLIYLEAGSGAKHPVSEEIIKAVKSELKIPVIVGGGIKTKNQLVATYKAGADMVVVGNVFEENIEFFNHIKRQVPITKDITVNP